MTVNTWLMGAAFAVSAAVPALAQDCALVHAHLDAVREQPQSYFGTKFQFEGRFQKLGEIYQPFFTRFDHSRYMNFSAWDVGQKLADREEFLDSWPLLYVDRIRGPAIESLGGLERFQRFKATGIVQSVFDGKAFIEVLDIVPLDCCWTCEQHCTAALKAAGRSECGCTFEKAGVKPGTGEPTASSAAPETANGAATAAIAPATAENAPEAAAEAGAPEVPAKATAESPAPAVEVVGEKTPSNG